MRFRHPYGTMILAIAGLAFSSSLPSSAGEQHFAGVREVDFTTYFEGYASGEGCTGRAELDVAFADLTGDGREEAIVNGYTCMAGTGGPNVHSIFTTNGSGALAELEVDQSKRWFHGRPIYNGLVGNKNFDFTHVGRTVVQTFSDSSGRQDPPLVLYYRWERGRFTLTDVHWGRTFPTSFSCEKVETAGEVMVCVDEGLASLDRDLARAYSGLLSKLPPTERRQLRTEQREWLKSRDGCAPYKWPEESKECLRNAYATQLSRLRTRLAREAEE